MPLYKPDPNDSTKQIPNIATGSNAANRHDRTTNPSRVTFTKTPNYVLVNKALNAGRPVGFFYGTDAEFAGLSDSDASSNYDIIGGALPAGTKLNIHPTAWSGSASDDGAITFVYKSGLSTGGF